MKEIKLSNSPSLAIVDDEDFENVSRFLWRLRPDGYVDTGRARTHMFLHHLVLQRKTGKLIDHKDRDKLNNRRSNLRYASKSQNNANGGLRVSNKSGFKGVSWFKRSSKWVAHIRVDGKQTNLGYFDLKEDAAMAYNRAALKAFGEFASVNNIPQTNRLIAACEVFGKEITEV